MFILSILRDTVRVQPRDFDKSRLDSIIRELNLKYGNKVMESPLQSILSFFQMIGIKSRFLFLCLRSRLFPWNINRKLKFLPWIILSADPIPMILFRWSSPFSKSYTTVFHSLEIFPKCPLAFFSTNPSILLAFNSDDWNQITLNFDLTKVIPWIWLFHESLTHSLVSFIN